VVSYLMGTILAGLIAGATLGSLGKFASALTQVSEKQRLLLLSVWALLGIALDAGVFGLRLPTVRRQVDDQWMYRYRTWVYGLGFGLQLGLGFLTVVSTSTVYSAFLAAFLGGSASMGALIGGVFGFIRGSMLFAVAGVQRPEQLVVVDGVLSKWDGPSRRLASAATLGLSAAALAVALL
jgi:hypothetical protein